MGSRRVAAAAAAVLVTVAAVAVDPGQRSRVSGRAWTGVVVPAAVSGAQPAGPLTPLDWDPASGPGETRGIRAGSGDVESAVGQLSSGCTATVIPSRSRRIAVTAAHCVYVPQAAPWRTFVPDLPVGWRTEGLEFWPGRVGDTAPFEAWAVEQVYVDKGWMAAGDMTLDFAFLLIAPRDGVLVQDVVGAEGIYSNFEQSRPAVTVIGYPAEGRFDGRTQRLCSSSAADRIPETSYFAAVGPDQLAIDCQMTRGASGGPWLADFDPSTGLGFVIGVTAAGNDTASFLTGTPLGEAARLLWSTPMADPAPRLAGWRVEEIVVMPAAVATCVG